MMELSNLYLYNYNNYFNKEVKVENTLGGYGEPVATLGSTNFKPNNGISTDHIINEDFSSIQPDYLVVTDLYNSIDSRWFVTSCTRTRKDQYRLALLRDVMADFYPNVLDSTCFIERGNLPSTDDMIFNSEGVSFNQIKKGETLLYDRTGTPWLIGYLPTNSQLITEQQTVSVVADNTQVLTGGYDEVKDWADNPKRCVYSSDALFKTASDISHGGTEYSITTVTVPSYISGATASKEEGKTLDTTIRYASGSSTASIRSACLGCAEQRIFVSSNLSGLYQSAGELLPPSAGITFANKYRNAVVSDTQGNFFRVGVEEILHTEKQTYDLREINPGTYEGCLEYLEGRPEFSGHIRYNNDLPSGIQLLINIVSEYRVTLQPISVGTYHVKFSNTAYLPEDAPYYMIAMPYNRENLQLMVKIGEKGASNVLDIQVLPYCPEWRRFNEDGTLISAGDVNKNFEYIKKADGSTAGYMFYCTATNFTLDIPFNIPLKDPKIQSNCDVYRLCSPNGNGQFEFDVAMNGGVDYINVDCTYRPYDPYIHLNPNFGRMYGQDYNDFRGLILGGDFSIPMVSDRWAEYITNNKNYANIFDREIQNLKTTQRYGRLSEILSGVVGIAQGAGAGALAGSIIPGAGTAIGAAAGGVLSAAGMIGDVAINDALRAEQLSVKEDLWNMQLQNIQAIPQSVSKTGCLTYNNKLVPYVEYYTCSEAEKQALREKIYWTGMSVGRVGKVREFYNMGDKPYVQGSLIHIDINNDLQIVNRINEVLQGGVYFG